MNSLRTFTGSENTNEILGDGRPNNQEGAAGCEPCGLTTAARRPWSLS